MVKHLQQADSCVSPPGKRVSFETDCKSEDYSSAIDEEGISIGVADVLRGDDIKRFLKLMQSLNVSRMDGVERFADISKTTNAERNEIFGGPKGIVSDINLHKHKKECLKSSTCTAKNTDVRQTDVSPVDITNYISRHMHRIDSKQLGLTPVAKPSEGAVDGVNCLGEFARNRVVMRADSVESASTEDTGSGNSSRRGSGDSLVQEPCRGYSTQRRHGRKDSLGTVDFTRLIPTLVSDNEDFRHKEYQRSLTVHPMELQHSTW